MTGGTWERAGGGRRSVFAREAVETRKKRLHFRDDVDAATEAAQLSGETDKAKWQRAPFARPFVCLGRAGVCVCPGGAQRPRRQLPARFFD